MLSTNKLVEGYLAKSKKTLDSLKADEEIKARIEPFGINEGRIDAGISKRNDVDATYHELLTRRSEQLKKSNELQDMFKNLKSQYSIDTRIFRNEMYADRSSIIELNLDDRTKRTIPAFLVQGRNFYTNVKVKPHLLDRVQEYGITLEVIQLRLDAIDAMDALYRSHSWYRGECQGLVQKRDLKLSDLKRFMASLKQVLFAAYPPEERQTLERINVFVRNQKKKLSVSTSPGDDEPPSEDPPPAEEPPPVEAPPAEEPPAEEPPSEEPPAG